MFSAFKWSQNAAEMGQRLEMAQNSNYPENSEKILVNHIHHIIESGKVSTNLSIRLVNAQQCISLFIYL
jgi:hypothetical protein